ncbi:MAG: arsenate reductase ArsC [Desulfitobacteriaceae bacterium]|nr:arsenate reductase ArsC [Desulfitobacteriaceae bacterium]
MKRVLFVCVHNSGRSQMAEAFAKKLGAGKVVAESAGTKPADVLNPTVVQAMEEIGYDMSGHYPKVMTSEMIKSADKVITMGCGVNVDNVGQGAVCPMVFVESEDWGLEDPEGQPIEKVREIRDQIRQKVERLIEELGDE